MPSGNSALPASQHAQLSPALLPTSAPIRRHTHVPSRARACAPASIWWQTYTARASARCASSACSTSGAAVMMRCRPPRALASGPEALRLHDGVNSRAPAQGRPPAMTRRRPLRPPALGQEDRPAARLLEQRQARTRVPRQAAALCLPVAHPAPPLCLCALATAHRLCSFERSAPACALTLGAGDGKLKLNPPSRPSPSTAPTLRPARALVCRQCRSAAPSMAYAASVQGVPTKPSTAAAPPTSARSARSTGATNGSALAGSSSGRSARTRSRLRCSTSKLKV